LRKISWKLIEEKDDAIAGLNSNPLSIRFLILETLDILAIAILSGSSPALFVSGEKLCAMPDTPCIDTAVIDGRAIRATNIRVSPFLSVETRPGVQTGRDRDNETTRSIPPWLRVGEVDARYVLVAPKS